MKRLFLVAAAAALAGAPAVGNAQSTQSQAPPQTSSVGTSGSESEVVWLRRRVEQLEAQLASGSNCSAGMRPKGKQAKPSNAAPMGDQMGMPPGGMGSMGDQPMGPPQGDKGTMKGHDHPKKNNGNMQQNSGGMQDM